MMSFSDYRLDVDLSEDWQTPAHPGISLTASSKPIDRYSRRDLTIPVEDQGRIGSCLGMSGKVVMMDSKYRWCNLSAKFIYLNGKRYDSLSGENYSGSTIRGACAGLKRDGACLDISLPYDGKDSSEVKFSADVLDDANKRRLHQYFIIKPSSTSVIQTELQKQSLWVSLKAHYELYNVNSNGRLKNEPNYLSSKDVGGHAVALVGWKYVGNQLYWEFQNSWGARFGDEGYFFLSDTLFRKICRSIYQPVIKWGSMSFVERLWMKIRNRIRSLIPFLPIMILLTFLTGCQALNMVGIVDTTSTNEYREDVDERLKEIADNQAVVADSSAGIAVMIEEDAMADGDAKKASQAAGIKAELKFAAKKAGVMSQRKSEQYEAPLINQDFIITALMTALGLGGLGKAGMAKRTITSLTGANERIKEKATKFASSTNVDDISNDPDFKRT